MKQPFLKAVSTLLLAVPLVFGFSSCQDEEDALPSPPKTGHFSHVERAEIVFIEGHMHGNISFHENLYAPRNKYMGRRDTMRFTLQNDQWIADTRNPKQVACESNFPRYAVVINYYDKSGKLLNGQFADDLNHAQHRHFFSITDLRPTFDGDPKDKIDSLGKFCDYTYVDTTPWDKTLKGNAAKWRGKNNPVGFKGFFHFKKARQQFTLNIRFVYSKSQEVLGKTTLPWYHTPNIVKSADTDALPLLQIPVIVYMSNTERDVSFTSGHSHHHDHDADHDHNEDADEDEDDDTPRLEDITKDKLTPKDIRSLTSFQRAYDITFEQAIAEFYYNLFGERPPHSAPSYWF